MTTIVQFIYPVTCRKHFTRVSSEHTGVFSPVENCVENINLGDFQSSGNVDIFQDVEIQHRRPQLLKRKVICQDRSKVAM